MIAPDAMVSGRYFSGLAPFSCLYVTPDFAAALANWIGALPCRIASRAGASNTGEIRPMMAADFMVSGSIAGQHHSVADRAHAAVERFHDFPEIRIRERVACGRESRLVCAAPSSQRFRPRPGEVAA